MHRAFTWGVLDRLLEEPRLKIEAISRTSAGAMNGALLVRGYKQGGAEGARAALEAYWMRVAEAAQFSPIQRFPLDRLMNRWSLDTSPGYLKMDLMSRVVSPYSLNPLGVNLISDILEKSVDFAHLGDASIELFITATNVDTGRGGASSATRTSRPTCCSARPACRQCFQVIEIDGLMARDAWTSSSLFTPTGSAADKVGQTTPSVGDHEKRASPFFPCSNSRSNRKRRPKDRRPTPRRTRDAGA